MTPELEALARRAVACKGWRWMAGMQAVDLSIPADRMRAQRLGNQFAQPADGRPWVPDLADPCTLGGLLALVREAWGEQLIYVERGAVDRVTAPLADPICDGPTEAAALVAALEAAP